MGEDEPQPQSAKEIALAKFIDNSVQILTQAELRTQFQKRRNDKFWKSVQFIQSFTRIKVSHSLYMAGFHCYIL